jgi:hypothetical protein
VIFFFEEPESPMFWRRDSKLPTAHYRARNQSVPTTIHSALSVQIQNN